MLKKQNAIPHNKRLLDEPLWVPRREGKQGTEIHTHTGYSLECHLGLPTLYDKRVLAALAMHAQERWDGRRGRQQYEWVSVMSFSKYLELLGQKDKKVSYKEEISRINASLERWFACTIHMDQYIDIGGKQCRNIERLNIFTRQCITRTMQGDWNLRVYWNPFFIEELIDNPSFFYVPLSLYSELSPVAMRLYEILCKNFQGRWQWEISRSKLKNKIYGIAASEDQLRVSEIQKCLDSFTNRDLRMKYDKKSNLFVFYDVGKWTKLCDRA